MDTVSKNTQDGTRHLNCEQLIQRCPKCAKDHHLPKLLMRGMQDGSMFSCCHQTRWCFAPSVVFCCYSPLWIFSLFGQFSINSRDGWLAVSGILRPACLATATLPHSKSPFWRLVWTSAGHLDRAYMPECTAHVIGCLDISANEQMSSCTTWSGRCGCVCLFSVDPGIICLIWRGCFSFNWWWCLSVYSMQE